MNYKGHKLPVESKWSQKLLDRYICSICFTTISVFILVQGLPVVVAQSNIDSNGRLSPADVFDEVHNSVVSIVTTNQHDPKFAASGSGFVYDELGHIITNNHVVDLGDKFFVTFIDGNEYSAKLLGKDQYADLAVLQIENSAVSAQHPKAVVFENSSDVRVGEEVVAMGNPLGLFGGSVTTGVVSQTNRPIAVGSPFQIPNAIQTDAAIQPGNSGGPLFNLDGKVIGVNSAGFGGRNIGLNFAIPSNTVQKIVPHLIESGSYKHPWMGAIAYTLNPLTRIDFGLPDDARGVLVTEVTAGTPINAAGIIAGDIIMEADGRIIRTIEQLTSYVDDKSVGDSLTLKVLRQGSSRDIQVSLTERPTQFTLREQNPPIE